MQGKNKSIGYLTVGGQQSVVSRRGWECRSHESTLNARMAFSGALRRKTSPAEEYKLLPPARDNN